MSPLNAPPTIPHQDMRLPALAERVRVGTHTDLDVHHLLMHAEDRLSLPQAVHFLRRAQAAAEAM